MYRRRKDFVSFTYVFNLEAAVTGEPNLMFCVVIGFFSSAGMMTSICRSVEVSSLVFRRCLVIRLRGRRYPGLVHVRAGPVGAYNKWTDPKISRMYTLSCTCGPLDFSGTYDSLIYHRSPTPTQMCICCAPIILTILGCHHVLLLYFIQSRSSRLFSSKWRRFST
ncbi:hypothetical protein IW262DRAFT_247038 [Armillaria fumosa]|nr:hypothetical protein IW262DRAFT_247038 [Armillaria fumosa]